MHTILCSYREDITIHNNLVFSKKFVIYETSHVSLHAVDQEVTTWLNDRYFERIEVIAIGALVMFTKNVCIPKGVVKGVSVTMIAIDHSDDGRVSSIKVVVNGTSSEMMLMRHTFQHKHTYEIYYGKAFFFSVVLACAMTGHKCQNNDLCDGGHSKCICSWFGVCHPLTSHKSFKFEDQREARLP